MCCCGSGRVSFSGGLALVFGKDDLHNGIEWISGGVDIGCVTQPLPSPAGGSCITLATLLWFLAIMPLVAPWGELAYWVTGSVSVSIM